MKKFQLLSLIFTGFLLSQCAASQSLNSISTSSQSLNSISTALNSVSSISQSLASISGSLTPDARTRILNYESDVEVFTFMYLNSENKTSFEEEMKNLALSHSILMWENESSTFLGIGKGMKKAGLSEVDVKDFFKKENYKNNTILSLIQKGYQS